MSQGNNGVPAGSFGGSPVQRRAHSRICDVALKDLRCLQEKQMCPGGQFWLVSRIKDRTRGFAMSRSRICDVSRKQMCPSGQFRWVFRIKERARGFAMSRSRICEVSMKQRCSSGQFWGVSSIKERAQKSPVLRKAQSRICDVSRKQRWSAGQFLWVSSIKERTRGFAMSPGKLQACHAV